MSPHKIQKLQVKGIAFDETVEESEYEDIVPPSINYKERNRSNGFTRNGECWKSCGCQSRYEHSRGSYQAGLDSSSTGSSRIFYLLYLCNRERENSSVPK